MAKTAVIGAGVMGLACAYELLKRGHSVDIYEADDRVGGEVDQLLLPVYRRDDRRGVAHGRRRALPRDAAVPEREVAVEQSGAVILPEHVEGHVADEYRGLVVVSQAVPDVAARRPAGP